MVEIIPVVQSDPVHRFAGQVQLPGATHTPLFVQGGVHTARIKIEIGLRSAPSANVTIIHSSDRCKVNSFSRDTIILQALRSLLSIKI